MLIRDLSRTDCAAALALVGQFLAGTITMAACQAALEALGVGPVASTPWP